MRVLVLGSGAREHALVTRLAADPNAGELLAAPGNPGIARVARTVPIDAMDLDAVAALAAKERIDLTVVGPELPLSLGVADRFASEGVIASMQPSHAIGDLYFAPSRLGPERLAGAYAWHSLLDSGAIVAAGTDAPVEKGDPSA